MCTPCHATDDLTGEPLMEAKVASLLSLMGRMTFHQAVVFCNSRPDGEHLLLGLESNLLGH